MHSAGISDVLMEVMLCCDKPKKASGSSFDKMDEILKELSIKSLEDKKTCPPKEFELDFDLPVETAPALPQRQDEDAIRRERDMSRLLGRWTIAPHRCSIEITRAGEHFILTYCKRNGRPTGNRFVLRWYDGDILYYGGYDTITVLALNTETDTLMVSPGEDYTRLAEGER